MHPERERERDTRECENNTHMKTSASDRETYESDVQWCIHSGYDNETGKRRELVCVCTYLVLELGDEIKKRRLQETIHESTLEECPKLGWCFVLDSLEDAELRLFHVEICHMVRMMRHTLEALLRRGRCR